MLSKQPPVYLWGWDLGGVHLGEDAPGVHDGQADQGGHKYRQVSGAERGEPGLDQAVQRRDQHWETASQQAWRTHTLIYFETS